MTEIQFQHRLIDLDEKYGTNYVYLYNTYGYRNGEQSFFYVLNRLDTKNLTTEYYKEYFNFIKTNPKDIYLLLEVDLIL